MKIRPARAEEAEALAALAFRAKAHWGYDDAFMEACRAELCWPAELIGAGGFHVAEDDGGRLLGFHGLLKISPNTAELEALFVEPAHIGQGHGGALLRHALAQCAALPDVERLVVQADPHAADFYEHAGAEKIGERPSASIPGRSLPVYQLVVEPADG